MIFIIYRFIINVYIYNMLRCIRRIEQNINLESKSFYDIQCYVCLCSCIPILLWSELLIDLLGQTGVWGSQFVMNPNDMRTFQRTVGIGNHSRISWIPLFGRGKRGGLMSK